MLPGVLLVEYANPSGTNTDSEGSYCFVVAAGCLLGPIILAGLITMGTAIIGRREVRPTAITVFLALAKGLILTVAFVVFCPVCMVAIVAVVGNIDDLSGIVEPLMALLLFALAPGCLIISGTLSLTAAIRHTRRANA